MAAPNPPSDSQPIRESAASLPPLKGLPPLRPARASAALTPPPLPPLPPPLPPTGLAPWSQNSVVATRPADPVVPPPLPPPLPDLAAAESEIDSRSTTAPTLSELGMMGQYQIKQLIR